MARRSFLRRKPKNDQMSLQITSMADIFTIILVFLLKSYSIGAIDVNPTAGMQIPQAKASDQTLQALKIEISETAVSVEGKPIVKIENFAFHSGQTESSGVSASLLSALESERAREQGHAGPHKPDPRVVVIADQRAPYSTIKTVLASAALRGYTDVKLAVTHAD